MIRLIAAIDQKQGIAKHGFQPWYIPADEQYFREQTMLYGAVVLMGRATFEVIGHPIKNRRNIVLSNQPLEVADVETAESLEVLNTLSNVWIIGGASVFAQTIGKADELYLTHIDADFGCDQFFPDFRQHFRQVQSSAHQQENGFTFRYSVYKK